jgi:hypothetical protein
MACSTLALVAGPAFAEDAPGAQEEEQREETVTDNVFEEEYERVFEGVYEPGRNFKIAASYQFGG